MFLAVASLAALAIPSRTPAQVVTSTWIGSSLTGTGDWSNDLYWLSPPQPGYDVVIRDLLLFPAVVTLDVDASVGQLTLGPGATLIVGNARKLQLNTSSAIDGRLTLDATTTFTELVVGGTSALSGAGSIVMSANANNRIRGATPTDQLVNRILIEGGGSIGAGQMSLSNEGKIIANTSLAPLIIQPNASGVINSGTLSATNNATLTLQSGDFDNRGGTIAALDGSKVGITNADVSGGNLATVGSGTIELSDATLTGVALTNSPNGVVRILNGINLFSGLYSDAATSQVRIDDGAKIIVPGGPVNLNGGIFIDSVGSDSVFEISAAELSVTGTGHILLSNNAHNRVIGTGVGAALMLGPAITLRGAGELGAGTLKFTNHGSIIADQSNALIVQPGVLGFANAGTLRSTAGSTLVLRNGTFANTSSGTIVADPASEVDVVSSTITGGNLTSIGSGHFHAQDSILANVTITPGSTIEVGDGNALTLAGSIVNDGLISLLSSGNTTELRVDSSVSIAGSGSIGLSDSSRNRIASVGSTGALAIGVGQSVTGAGEVGHGSVALTNHGTIIANGVNPLVIDSSGTHFTNHGELKASGSGGLTVADASVTNLGAIDVSAASMVKVDGAFTQSGNASVTRLAQGTFSSKDFALQDGILSGSGTINGPVTASGASTILVGGAGTIGTLAFTSTLDLGSSARLFFDLGGRLPGTEFDRIEGTNVALDGALFLSFTNGFESSLTAVDTLTLINTSTALNGTFSSLPDGSRLPTLDGFGSFQVNYLPNALTLSHFQAIPEPSTYVLLTVGVFGVLMAERRRRRRQP